MKDEKYYGDQLVKQLKKITEINGIKWTFLTNEDINFLKTELLENIETGVVGKFRELTNNNDIINWDIYILLTKNIDISKRYVLVVKDKKHNNIIVVPPDSFKDNKYLSNLVAFYQTVIYDINQNISKTLKEQLKLIDKFIDGWSETGETSNHKH